MKKNIPTPAIIAIAVVLVGLFAFLIFRGTEPKGGEWKAEERVLFEALEKAGGDPQKMDPKLREQLDEYMKNHPMSSRRAYEQGQPIPPTVQGSATAPR